MGLGLWVLVKISFWAFLKVRLYLVDFLQQVMMKSQLNLIEKFAVNCEK